jgi:hypothetical protein
VISFILFSGATDLFVNKTDEFGLLFDRLTRQTDVHETQYYYPKLTD